MTDLKRVFIKGGILSPSELKHIIIYAESLGLDALHFGSRQDIIFPKHAHNDEVDNKFPDVTTAMMSDRSHQNIVCSYVSSDIFPTTTWLKGSTYLYILERYKYHPLLKINIVDPIQKLVPLFSGELNFIASPYEDYWYLQLKLPLWKKSVYYPVLVYSWNIPKVSKIIEEVYTKTDNEDHLFQSVNQQFEGNNRTIQSDLKLDFKPFPYYEGMNKMGVNEHWLGLYWRSNRYYLNFLKDFCNFCLDNKVGKICLTPWKSFIVKGIPAESILRLEKLLGKSGINIRHSLLELNWHLPVDDDEALKLKKFIVQSFDQNDISTYGLTFTISNRGQSKHYFTSIVIEKNVEPNMVQNFEVRSTYNVLHCEGFDPNTQNYIFYAEDVDKIELPGLLMELSRVYFDQISLKEKTKEKKEVFTTLENKPKSEEYQCKTCLTMYNPVYGDSISNVTINTSFQELSDTYICSVCEAPKSQFRKV